MESNILTGWGPEGDDIGKSFNKLTSCMYYKYHGLLFERTAAGFVHNGIICRSHEEMDILVEQEEKSLGISINRIKK